MSTERASASRRPLPRGLRLCETCAEVRGVTPRGAVSACYCSGLVCNRCGARVRRPISDYYDRKDRRWWHVPYFAQLAHTCQLGRGEAPKGTGWTILEPAPEVRAYQEAVTRWAFEQMGWDPELDIVAAERYERPPYATRGPDGPTA